MESWHYIKALNKNFFGHCSILLDFQNFSTANLFRPERDILAITVVLALLCHQGVIMSAAVEKGRTITNTFANIASWQDETPAARSTTAAAQSENREYYNYYTTTEHTHAKLIGDAIGKINTNFVAWGTVAAPTSGIFVTFKEANVTVQIAPPTLEEVKTTLATQATSIITSSNKNSELPSDVVTAIEKLQADKFEVLKHTMSHALFGKGTEMVLDPTVRKAYNLKAKNFIVAGISQHVYDQIMKETGKKLFPEIPISELVADPYSLNFYEPGGDKFAMHVDTPLGDWMLGTMVIRLHTYYTGGDFHFQHGNQKATTLQGYNAEQLNDVTQLPDDTTTLSWCAFYGSVDHEVKEVERGHRISLAYRIRRKDPQPQIPPSSASTSDEQESSQVIEALQTALLDENFLPQGGLLGIRSDHLYTSSEITRGKTNLKLEQIAQLKGRDLTSVRAVAALGIRLRFQECSASSSSDILWAVESGDHCEMIALDEAGGNSCDVSGGNTYGDAPTTESVLYTRGAFIAEIPSYIQRKNELSTS